MSMSPSKGAQALDLTYITGRTRQDMGGRWWINNGEIRQNLPLESQFDDPKNRLIFVAFLNCLVTQKMSIEGVQLLQILVRYRILE